MNIKTKIILFILMIILSAGCSCAQNNSAKDTSLHFEVKGEENLYIKLENGELYLLENEKKVWQADPSHDIENIVVTDIDGDNNTDILVSFWKYGSFGESKPFWFEGEDDEYTNHLFFYEIRNRKVRTRWGSSKINIPIEEMEAVNVEYKGKIITALKIKDEQGIGIWIWDNWGFTKTDLLV